MEEGKVAIAGQKQWEYSSMLATRSRPATCGVPGKKYTSELLYSKFEHNIGIIQFHYKSQLNLLDTCQNLS